MNYSKACTTLQVESFANLTKTYAGRDKCTKAIQYGSRLLMYLLLKDDPKNQLGNRFKGLFTMTRDARKIWRFPNIVTEYKTILTALDNTKDSTLIQALQILSRAAFAYYWVNDTLVYLCKAKFMTRDPANLNLHAQRGWFFGIFFGLLMQFIQLKDNFEKEAKMKDGPDAASTQVAILKERSSLYLKVIAGFGDLPVAANGSNFTQAVLGWQFNDGILGAGGLISALIGAYQLL